ADQARAALLDVDVDAQRTGVEAVLDQFLDHRSRTLDHLAGGDLVDEFGGKWPDAGHPDKGEQSRRKSKGARVTRAAGVSRRGSAARRPRARVRRRDGWPREWPRSTRRGS